MKFAVGETRRTHRTVQNKHYELRAFGVLGFTGETFPEEFRWLCDPEKQKPGRAYCEGFRRSILAELGRIEDEETLRAAARRMCQLRPKAREAMVMIRRFRLGGAKPGDALELANAVIATINDYMRRRPGLSADDIRDAIRTVEANII